MSHGPAVRRLDGWDADRLERLADATAEEDVPVTDLRDIWLSAANESFEEVMGTTAFAAATGQAVDEVLDAQSQVQAASQETLRELGLATRDDVQEVGERLVELERRQHAVEEKLDRVLEHLEE